MPEQAGLCLPWTQTPEDRFSRDVAQCFSLGWLEPLLDRVAADGTVIVAPMIDTISKDTFAVRDPELAQIGAVHIPTVEFKWLPMNEARQRNHPPHEPYK